MLELVLTVCSIVSGASCRDSQIPLQPEVGMMGCLIGAQVEGAKYVDAHPNFYITRYTCRPARMFAKI
jgi:hypothetical protein